MKITDIIGKTSPNEVIFWTGAGISYDNPTNLPLGYALTQKYVDAYCSQNTWSKIIKYFSDTNMQDALGNPKLAPRLEVILENIININGLEALDSFEPFYYALPNSNHFFFANHLIDGGSHVTTNFDNCIQSAVSDLDKTASVNTVFSGSDKKLSFEGTVVHIHGKYSPSEKTQHALGLRISNVAQGVIKPFDELIKEGLISKKSIIFLGYSGSDYFDINPFFHNLFRYSLDLSDLTAIWVNHEQDTSVQIIDNWEMEGKNGTSILRAIKNLSGKVIYLETNTATFLKEYSEFWNFDWIDTSTLSSISYNAKEELDN